MAKLLRESLHCNKCGQTGLFEFIGISNKAYLCESNRKNDFHGCRGAVGIKNAVAGEHVASPYARYQAQPAAKLDKRVLGINRQVQPSQAADMFRRLLNGEKPALVCRGLNASCECADCNGYREGVAAAAAMQLEIPSYPLIETLLASNVEVSPAALAERYARCQHGTHINIIGCGNCQEEKQEKQAALLAAYPLIDNLLSAGFTVSEIRKQGIQSHCCDCGDSIFGLTGHAIVHRDIRLKCCDICFEARQPEPVVEAAKPEPVIVEELKAIEVTPEVLAELYKIANNGDKEAAARLMAMFNPTAQVETPKPIIPSFVRVPDAVLEFIAPIGLLEQKYRDTLAS